jgi:hypothetical protein
MNKGSLVSCLDTDTVDGKKRVYLSENFIYISISSFLPFSRYVFHVKVALIPPNNRDVNIYVYLVCKPTFVAEKFSYCFQVICKIISLPLSSTTGEMFLQNQYDLNSEIVLHSSPERSL